MSESGEQITLISWFKLAYPEYHLIAIPNGAWIAGTGGRKFALINKYKKEGMKNGVSDLLLCVPKNGYNGLWLEMKDKGKTYCSVSKEQRLWLSDMEKQGYMSAWAAGFEQAKDIIVEYLTNP